VELGTLKHDKCKKTIVPALLRRLSTGTTQIMRPATSILAALISVCKALSQTDYAQHVNLFIGTEGPVAGSAYSAGNVFPGATLPFGAVKVGIDTTRSAIPAHLKFSLNRADVRNKDGIYRSQLTPGTRPTETAT
jgi:hypothetical protein